VAAYNLGLVRERQGRSDAAMSEYQSALVLRPEFFQALDNLGHLLLQAERPTDALPHLQRAATLNDSHPATCMNLGLCLAQLGRHQDALPWYRRALERSTAESRPTILANLDASLRALGRETETPNPSPDH